MYEKGSGLIFGLKFLDKNDIVLLKTSQFDNDAVRLKENIRFTPEIILADGERLIGIRSTGRDLDLA